MKVVVAAAASNDIQEIVSYIATERHEPDTAEAVGRSIFSMIESLGEFPERHPISHIVATDYPGTRQVSVGPFVIFYRVDNDAVNVARVMHGARDIGASFDSGT